MYLSVCVSMLYIFSGNVQADRGKSVHYLFYLNHQKLKLNNILKLINNGSIKGADTYVKYVAIKIA